MGWLSAALKLLEGLLRMVPVLGAWLYGRAQRDRDRARETVESAVDRVKLDDHVGGMTEEELNEHLRRGDR